MRVGGHHLHELDGPSRAQLPVDGGDQVALEPPVGLDVGHAAEHAGEHGGVLDAHLEVRLGAEEQLHVAGSAVGAALQALVGHPPEVGLLLDRPAHQRVDEQEVSQAVVLVEVGDLVMRRQLQAVLSGRRRERGRVHGPLQMQMQFGLRHLPQCSLNVHFMLPAAGGNLFGLRLRPSIRGGPRMLRKREPEPPAVSSPTLAGLVSKISVRKCGHVTLFPTEIPARAFAGPCRKSRCENVDMSPISLPRSLEPSARTVCGRPALA